VLTPVPIAPSDGRPRLDVIIVSWNSGRQLSACLESFGAACQPDFRLSHVVVVDNGSADDSLEDLPSIPARLSIVRNRTNRGFAAACNQGAALCDGEYLLFLNPDTRLTAGSLAQPIAFLESPDHAAVGAVGIQLIDDTGEIARSCARAPRPTMFLSRIVGLDRLAPRWFPPLIADDWDHRDSRLVAHVIGAFYLVRRTVWQALAGFDERFFVYLEDLDFSVRLRAGGWQIYYLSSARAFHRGGGSSASVKAARLCLSLHSRIRFGYKHFGRGAATVLLVATLFVEPVVRVSAALFGRDLVAAGHTVIGYGLLWRWLVLGRRPGLGGETSPEVAGARPAHG
jgi:GT2 family glycosyltransferase